MHVRFGGEVTVTHDDGITYLTLHGEWSFEIIEHQQLFDEVVVLGKLTAQGITKCQFGIHQITKTKKDGTVMNIGYVRHEARSAMRE